jgi:hypothetical protein
LAFTLALVLLGFNKQLDMQTLLMEVVRRTTYQYGWYDQRRAVQFVFIGVMAVLFAATTVVLLVLRRYQPQMGLSLVGAILLSLFAFVRAAAFQHVILLPAWPWLNATLEVAGIACVAAGVWI